MSSRLKIPKRDREPPMPRLSAETKMDVLRKTARIIGESWKIEVVFRGERAYTDGRTIVVPALAENAPDDLVEAIIGFVDHEVGHILESDFDESFKLINQPDADGKVDPRLHQMTNAIEDIRQEFRMSLRYRGVGLNLERTMIWVMERVVKQWHEPSMSPLFKLQALMMMRAKARLGIPMAQAFYDEMAGPMHPIIQRCEDELKTWYRLPSTVAAVHAARRVLKILDDLGEGKEPEKQQDQPGDKPEKKKKKKNEPDPDAPPDILTKRERKVMKAVHEKGLSLADIAAKVNKPLADVEAVYNAAAEKLANVYGKAA